jgi:hypothetical protein
MTQSRAESVVRRVVGDLLPDARVTFDVTDGLRVTVAAGNEVVCVVYADGDAPVADVAVHVGNVVQAAAIESLGRAVPACPGHVHPAELRVSGDEITWVCPHTGAVVEPTAT